MLTSTLFLVTKTHTQPKGFLGPSLPGSEHPAAPSLHLTARAVGQYVLDKHTAVVDAKCQAQVQEITRAERGRYVRGKLNPKALWEGICGLEDRKRKVQKSKQKT